MLVCGSGMCVLLEISRLYAHIRMPRHAAARETVNVQYFLQFSSLQCPVDTILWLAMQKARDHVLLCIR